MARGITESDVHTAADEIVGLGERPTVERVRAHLGTGSPNTVTRWLETWWQGLGRRLDAHHRSVAVPDAPDAVARLASELWASAMRHAQSIADDALRADRAALGREIQALESDREAFLAEAATLREQVAAAGHEAELATTRAAELQRLVDRLEEQVEEVGRQRDAAVAHAADGVSTRDALEARVRSLQDAALAERESLGQHVRAVEDRALKEIDRARQETKELQGRLTAAVRQSAAAEKSLRELIDQANTKAVEASREASAQRARADALEGQLGVLRDLPAALRAAFPQADPGSAARKSRSRSKVAPSKQTKATKQSSQPARRRRAKVAD